MAKSKIHADIRILEDVSNYGHNGCRRVDQSSSKPACGTYTWLSPQLTTNPAEVTCQHCKNIMAKRGVKMSYLKQHEINMDDPLHRLRAQAGKIMAGELEGVRKVHLDNQTYLIDEHAEVNINTLSAGLDAYQIEIKVRKVKLGLRSRG